MSKSISRTRQQPFELFLNRAVDCGIGGVLFLAPLAMAGRYEPGRLLLAVIVGLTAMAWFLSRAISQRSQQHWSWTGAEWIGLFAVVLVLLQLLPWSPGMLSWFSPEIDNILPLHAQSVEIATAETPTLENPLASEDSSTTDALPTDASSTEQQASAATTLPTATTVEPFFRWERISLTPNATRGGLAMAMIYVLLFFVVLQRCRRMADVERLMKGLALSGVFLAAVGLVQYMLSNGRFLWFMSHPSRDTLTSVKATFANENHFVHFLALTLGPLLWWLVKAQGDAKNNPNEQQPTFGSRKRVSYSQQQVLLCIGAGIVFLAGLLSYSRGGLVVLTLAALISVGLFLWQKRIGKKVVVAVCVAGAIASVAVLIHGGDILFREMETLETVSLESLDKDQGRRKIWTAVMSAVPDFAILGSGVGSHRYVYPTYFASKSSVQYTHAESGYLNLLLEAGGPGLGLLMVGIGLAAFWCWKSITSENEQVQFLAVPIVASLSISLLHATFDFNWYIPANMCVTLLLVVIGARLYDLSAEQEKLPRRRVSRATWSAMAVVALMMSAFAVSNYIGPARGLPAWHEFRAWSLASRSPGNGRQRELGKINAMAPDSVGHMIQLLDEVLRYDPGHGRAHTRMASLCLRQFELLQSRSENSMSLAQIRDAALSSDFESHQAMSEWINRVVGSNRVYLDRILWHSQQALKTTPTEGNAYLYLAEVAFLDEDLKSREYELMRQGYSVRPYDAAIQFSFGRHQLQAGNEKAGMALWKDAFGRGDSVRKRIIAAVGFQAPPQEILDLFQPDVDGQWDLFQYYWQRKFEPQMRYVGAPLVTELEKQAKILSGETAGDLWYKAQFVHWTLEDFPAAAAAAENAVLADPADFQNHYACASRLYDCGRYSDAADEFRWCAARKPQDLQLKKNVDAMRDLARKSKARNAQSIEDTRLQRR